MPILGLSSATKVISIGLIDGDRILIDKTIDDIRAEMILSYVKEAGIKPEQIEGVAVAIGPGSYSGLRGGVTAAKTLAMTLNIPLVGISTLEAIVFNAIGKSDKIAVMLDAKRDDFNFACFRVEVGQLVRETEDLVLKEPEIIARTKGKALLLDGRNVHPLGINVAKLGQLKIKAGQTNDPMTLVPKYSHQPNIREYPPS